MKPYIDFNTQKRKETTNEAVKNLFKLLNNSVYGKTMENMRKRIKIRLITNEKDFLKYVSRPTYIGYINFDKNLVAIHEKKELLTLNKPIYVGNAILELSKLAMYKFYYDFVKKKCKNPKLLFTDTDSLCIETEEDFHEIMYQNKEDSKYYCADNKKVPGKMKDKYGGTAIWDYTRTKSKMYSLHKEHNSLIENKEFKDVHSNKKVIRHKMRGFKSINHKIYTYKSNKTSLSCYDDKRYILSDGINTLPYGHKDIPK